MTLRDSYRPCGFAMQDKIGVEDIPAATDRLRFLKRSLRTVTDLSEEEHVFARTEASKLETLVINAERAAALDAPRWAAKDSFGERSASTPGDALRFLFRIEELLAGLNPETDLRCELEIAHLVTRLRRASKDKLIPRDYERRVDRALFDASNALTGA